MLMTCMLPSCARAAEVVRLRAALGAFRDARGSRAAREPTPSVEAMPATLLRMLPVRDIDEGSLSANRLQQ